MEAVTTMFKPEVVVQAPISLLGEGPHYEKQSNRLIWVDIEGLQIHRLDLTTNNVTTIIAPQRVGAIVPTDRETYICGMEDGIYELDFDESHFSLVVPLEPERDDHRTNDGKCDPYGRFWIGTYKMGALSYTGNLYSFTAGQLRAESHLTKIGCSNGMAWTADQSTYYFIDSPTQSVFAFDYDKETSTITNQRTVITIDKNDGMPDGMTIDQNDHLWIAHWGGACITKWNPRTGECLQKISVPVSNVTSLCFAGEKFDTLYVTTAKVGLSDEQREKEPLAGSIFKLQVDVTGKENFIFKS